MRRGKVNYLAIHELSGRLPDFVVRCFRDTWAVLLSPYADTVNVWLVNARFHRDRLVGRLSKSWLATLSPDERWKEMHRFIKKWTAEELGGAIDSEVDDADFRRDYPALGEYLYSTRYPDGTERKTGTVVVFVDRGMVKGFFTDKATDMQICCTAPTFTECLLALECALCEEKPPWRRVEAWKPPNGKPGGKRG